MALYSRRTRIPDSATFNRQQFGDSQDIPMDWVDREYDAEPTAEDIGADDVVVDFPGSQRMIADDDDMRITDTGRATIVDFAPGQAVGEPGYGDDFANEIDFGANLAEFLEPYQLGQIADDLIEKVQFDERARQPWLDRIKRGLYLLGLEDAAEDDLVGTIEAQYPMLGEACLQFNANAKGEIFPPGGPCKTRVMGKETPDIREQADRVSDHMNYQLTVEDTAYYVESDSLLMQLPWQGSMFRKTYYDHECGMPVARIVEPTDFIVPYTATSLETAERYTHRIRMSQNKLLKEQAVGVYMDIDVGRPSDPLGGSAGEADRLFDESQDKTPEVHDDDYEHILLEVHVNLDLPGFEDERGIMLPYIVTVEQESRQVLAIRRNWKPDDENQRKRVWFHHYRFVPGVGFYGMGYIHLIGALSEAASDALMALLDSATAASMQGGFKSKDIRLSDRAGGEFRIEHGVWKEVEASTDELQKGFYTPPFREPAPALFNLLGFLVDALRRFTSTTETLTGEGDNKAPVGTTVALLERGMKVYSAIHQRIHETLGGELRALANLNSDYLPKQGYPYAVEGADRSIMRADYDARVDVIPVSDPHIFSATQRIGIAQAVTMRADAVPQRYHGLEVERMLLKALRVPNADALLNDPTKTARLDPVAENMAILAGRPIAAYPDQNHEAHLAVLMGWFYSLPPDGQKMAMPAVMAHAAEHFSYMYGIQMMQAGVPMESMPSLRTLPGEPMYQGGEQDPQAEAAIAVQAAQATMAVAEKMKQLGAKVFQEQEPPEDMKAKAEIARKDMAAAAEEERKKVAFNAEQARLDQENLREAAREGEKIKVETAAKAEEGEVDVAIERERMQHEVALKDRELKMKEMEVQLQRDQFNAQQRAARGEADIEVPNEGESPPDWRTMMGGVQEQVQAMAQSSAEAAAAQGQATTELAKSIAQIAQSMQAATEALARAATVMAAPRKLEMDANGMPSIARPMLEQQGSAMQ